MSLPAMSHFQSGPSLCVCVCEDDLCLFIFSAQVYQLPTYRDEHFPTKPGPRPSGGAADAESELGGVRPAGARTAWGSKPEAGQEI